MCAPGDALAQLPARGGELVETRRAGVALSIRARVRRADDRVPPVGGQRHRRAEPLAGHRGRCEQRATRHLRSGVDRQHGGHARVADARRIRVARAREQRRAVGRRGDGPAERIAFGGSGAREHRELDPLGRLPCEHEDRAAPPRDARRAHEEAVSVAGEGDRVSEAILRAPGVGGQLRVEVPAIVVSHEHAYAAGSGAPRRAHRDDATVGGHRDGASERVVAPVRLDRVLEHPLVAGSDEDARADGGRADDDARTVGRARQCDAPLLVLPRVAAEQARLLRRDERALCVRERGRCQHQQTGLRACRHGAHGAGLARMVSHGSRSTHGPSRGRGARDRFVARKDSRGGAP